MASNLADMEQRHLGRTGLRVSRIGLGTLTWGRDTEEHDAADMLKAFWEPAAPSSTPPTSTATERRSTCSGG